MLLKTNHDVVFDADNVTTRGENVFKRLIRLEIKDKKPTKGFKGAMPKYGIYVHNASIVRDFSHS